jgi:hypothetical protein
VSIAGFNITSRYIFVVFLFNVKMFLITEIFMKRENYLKKIHEMNYEGSTSYEKIITKESEIMVPLNSEDIDISLTALRDKINVLHDGIISTDINKLDVIRLVQNNKGIAKNLNNENVLALGYNSLYDFFIEHNRIESYDISTLYRLEAENGDGIITYLAEQGDEISNDYYYDTRTKPGPGEDTVLKSLFTRESGSNFRQYSKDWFFSFKNKGQLLEWFDEELSKIIIDKSKNKVYVAEYIVPAHETLNTKSQTVFRRKNAKKLKKILFSEFLLKEQNTIESILKNTAKIQQKTTNKKKLK